MNPSIAGNPSHSRLKPFVVPVFIPHRGCPHRCVFCNQKKITASKGNRPAPRDLHKQIETFLQYRRHRHQRTQIAFYGGNFLGISRENRRRLLTAARAFIGAGEANGIRFSTRPDTIDNRTLSALQAYPVETVEIGIQSMDETVLQQCHRGHTAAQCEMAVQILKEHGLEVGAQMMIGLPGESRASALFSANRIAALKPDFARIYPTVVLADSLLEKWFRSGRYQPLSLESAVTRAKEVRQVFVDAGIPVVRTGLQATPGFNRKKNIVAGPWHPAFGELVLAESYLDRAVYMLSALPESRKLGVLFRLHPRDHSAFRGQHNINISILEQRFRLASVQILEDDHVDRGAFTVTLAAPLCPGRQ